MSVNSAGVAGVYRLRFWTTVVKTQHTPTGPHVHFRPVRHNYMVSAEVKDSGWIKLFHPTLLMQRSNIESLHSFCFRHTLFRFNCNINSHLTNPCSPAMFTNHGSPLRSHPELTSANSLPCLQIWKMQMSNIYLQNSAKDSAEQFPGVLHASGGKLFCMVCNIVVEHKRKLSLDKHFPRKTAS